VLGLSDRYLKNTHPATEKTQTPAVTTTQTGHAAFCKRFPLAVSVACYFYAVQLQSTVQTYHSELHFNINHNDIQNVIVTLNPTQSYYHAQARQTYELNTHYHYLQILKVNKTCNK